MKAAELGLISRPRNQRKCHPRESGGPGPAPHLMRGQPTEVLPWIPAFAGMTGKGMADQKRQLLSFGHRCRWITSGPHAAAIRSDRQARAPAPPPSGRDSIGLRPERPAAARRRAVHIEQRAIGIEDDGIDGGEAGHGPAISEETSRGPERQTASHEPSAYPSPISWERGLGLSSCTYRVPSPAKRERVRVRACDSAPATASNPARSRARSGCRRCGCGRPARSRARAARSCGSPRTGCSRPSPPHPRSSCGDRGSG